MALRFLTQAFGNTNLQEMLAMPLSCRSLIAIFPHYRLNHVKLLPENQDPLHLAQT